MPTQKKYHQIYIGLVAEDKERLDNTARATRITSTEQAREAIRWYLDHHEELKAQSKESATAQAIRYATDKLVEALSNATDRICRMLARQGRAIGTLYELSWMSLPDDKARDAFNEAAAVAKKRMARHVENDEKELAERMKKVVNS